MAACAWLVGVGCLFSPPIEQRPEELDVPPEFDFADITPDPRRRVTLERGEGEIEFGLREVRDRNEGDELTYLYQLEDSAGFVLSVPGSLRVDEEATAAGDGLTVYQPVLLSVDPCDAELLNEETLTVSLTLLDVIPPEQRQGDEQTSYEIPIVWNVRLEGVSSNCPDELPGI